MAAQAATKPDGRVARRTGTREAIMDAATELFAARGVTSTAIDDIAVNANIAKGSIYYNFESKAGLVEAIVERSSTLLRETLRQASAGYAGPELQARIVRALLLLVRDNAAAARLMVAELFRTERSWQESIRTWRALALAPLVDDLQSTGIGPDVAAIRAASVVGATLVAGLDWLVFHPELQYEDVVAAVLSTLRG